MKPADGNNGATYNCLVVLGPTASGKTRLAAQLAYQLNGEIISADSRQVYTGLDIGAGKDLQDYVVEGHRIPYHLIDVHAPEEQFYLHHFMKGLRDAFDDIRARGRLPVVTGGTGLYLDALRKDFSFTLAPEDHELRAELDGFDRHALFLELQRLSPAMASGIDMSSKKRLIRGIEIARHFGQIGLPEPQGPLPYAPYYIGIRVEAKERRQRIGQRLAKRFTEGLIGEAERLLSQGVSHSRLQRLGLEYKYLSEYLLGRIDQKALSQKLETAIVQFSKRQMTWFRKMEKEGVRIQWISPDTDAVELARQIGPLFLSESP